MAKNNNKNKKGIVKKVIGIDYLFHANVLWQLLQLGSMGVGAFVLYHVVSDKHHYSLTDCIIIVVAVTLAVTSVVRIAELVHKEATHDRSE